MLEALVGGLQYFIDPSFVGWVVAGALIGVIMGVIPAIGGMEAIAIFLPFTFVLRPEQALPFMIAVMSTTFTGGLITAVLLGIPGDGPNIACCLDGFPMTQKGEGGRALGVALISSGLGGIISALLALVMIPVVLILVFAITAGDMVFVILLGLLCLGLLSAGALRKGLISGGLGLLISFIGYQAQSGLPRFTFGTIYLYDGITLLPLVLGLFAMPVMIEMITRCGDIVKTQTITKGMQNVRQAVKDILRSPGIFLRGTLIGYIVGIIPGIGAMTATWVSYAQGKKTSKHTTKFGTGAVDGLIAASSATNGSLGGDLLCTLALGIPGSASMAIILGGMLMVGLTPGPKMLTDHTALSISLIYVVAVANIIGAGICLFFAPQLAKIANIRAHILVAILVPIIFVGTFAVTQEFNDLIVLVIATIVGEAMEKFGYNRPSLFMGYILGNLFEYYFFLALDTAGPLFFMRPISLTIIIIMLLMISYNRLKNLFMRLVSKN